MGELPVWSRQPVLTTAVALGALLTAFSQRYDYHRDELYFRMLEPAWGYVDQPPLAPLLADLTQLLADQPWALRLPSTIAVSLSVIVVTLVTRELGGGRAAQLIAAFAYAGSAAVMIFGHVLLTSTFDLLVWPLVCLFVLRGLLRGEGHWWVYAGLVAGLASYDKLLVVWLLLGIGVGLLTVGPRHVLLSRPVLAACGVCLLLALPNVIYQATHGWPQLEMGAALAENNAGEVRWFMWVLLVLVLGPPLVPIWVAGIVALLRRPEWRPARCLVVAFGVVLLFTFVSGAQPHYPTGLVVVFLAVGAVPAAELVARSRPWRGVLAAGLVLNAGVSALIGLPVLSVATLGETPVPDLSIVAADQVGWRRYVEQIASVTAEVDVQTVVTSNYGEAGAVARYAPELEVYSGQNALYDVGPPPTSVSSVVFVGEQLSTARELFDECVVATRLDNRVGVDNEEQGVPVAVCSGLRQPWSVSWPRLHHLD
ncbi:MAG TPA: glycosyltransferase family 39 protein [Nocardioidaceae bacterium]|nr:glycosyltransferase family 39 protein [Nocardioidaceae bacterium]